MPVKVKRKKRTKKPKPKASPAAVKEEPESASVEPSGEEEVPPPPPPVLKLLRQISDESRAGAISAEQKSKMKDAIIAQYSAAHRAANASLSTDSDLKTGTGNNGSGGAATGTGSNSSAGAGHIHFTAAALESVSYPLVSLLRQLSDAARAGTIDATTKHQLKSIAITGNSGVTSIAASPAAGSGGSAAGGGDGVSTVISAKGKVIRRITQQHIFRTTTTPTTARYVGPSRRSAAADSKSTPEDSEISTEIDGTVTLASDVNLRHIGGDAVRVIFTYLDRSARMAARYVCRVWLRAWYHLPENSPQRLISRMMHHSIIRTVNSKLVCSRLYRPVHYARYISDAVKLIECAKYESDRGTHCNTGHTYTEPVPYTELHPPGSASGSNSASGGSGGTGTTGGEYKYLNSVSDIPPQVQVLSGDSLGRDVWTVIGDVARLKVNIYRIRGIPNSRSQRTLSLDFVAPRQTVTSSVGDTRKVAVPMTAANFAGAASLYACCHLSRLIAVVSGETTISVWPMDPRESYVDCRSDEPIATFRLPTYTAVRSIGVVTIGAPPIADQLQTADIKSKSMGDEKDAPLPSVDESDEKTDVKSDATTTANSGSGGGVSYRAITSHVPPVCYVCIGLTSGEVRIHNAWTGKIRHALFGPPPELESAADRDAQQKDRDVASRSSAPVDSVDLWRIAAATGSHYHFHFGFAPFLQSREYQVSPTLAPYLPTANSSVAAASATSAAAAKNKKFFDAAAPAPLQDPMIAALKPGASHYAIRIATAGPRHPPPSMKSTGSGGAFAMSDKEREAESDAPVVSSCSYFDVTTGAVAKPFKPHPRSAVTEVVIWRSLLDIAQPAFTPTAPLAPGEKPKPLLPHVFAVTIHRDRSILVTDLRGITRVLQAGDSLIMKREWATDKIFAEIGKKHEDELRQWRLGQLAASGESPESEFSAAVSANFVNPTRMSVDPESGLLAASHSSSIKIWDLNQLIAAVDAASAVSVRDAKSVPVTLDPVAWYEHAAVSHTTEHHFTLSIDRYRLMFRNARAGDAVELYTHSNLILASAASQNDGMFGTPNTRSGSTATMLGIPSHQFSSRERIASVTGSLSNTTFAGAAASKFGEIVTCAVNGRCIAIVYRTGTVRVFNLAAEHQTIGAVAAATKTDLPQPFPRKTIIQMIDSKTGNVSCAGMAGIPEGWYQPVYLMYRAPAMAIPQDHFKWEWVCNNQNTTAIHSYRTVWHSFVTRIEYYSSPEGYKANWSRVSRPHDLDHSMCMKYRMWIDWRDPATAQNWVVSTPNPKWPGDRDLVFRDSSDTKTPAWGLRIKERMGGVVAVQRYINDWCSPVTALPDSLKQFQRATSRDWFFQHQLPPKARARFQRESKPTALSGLTAAPKR